MKRKTVRRIAGGHSPPEIIRIPSHKGSCLVGNGYDQVRIAIGIHGYAASVRRIAAARLGFRISS